METTLTPSEFIKKYDGVKLDFGRLDGDFDVIAKIEPYWADFELLDDFDRTRTGEDFCVTTDREICFSIEDVLEASVRREQKEENNMFNDFRDTIEILGGNGEYTLITYMKGGNREWCVALHYNTETRTWDAGNYAYSFQSALTTYLTKVGDPNLKSSSETCCPICFDRMSELATKFKDGLVEDDKDSALEYFKGECEMTDEELRWFGIDTREYAIVEVETSVEYRAVRQYVVPKDKANDESYIQSIVDSDDIPESEFEKATFSEPEINSLDTIESSLSYYEASNEMTDNDIDDLDEE